MLVKTLALVVGLAIAAQATFHRGAGQGNGVYLAELVDGVETYTKIAELNTTAGHDLLAGLQARLPIPNPFPRDAYDKCCGNYLVHSDFFDHAYNAFWNGCAGRTFFDRQAFFVEYDSARAYMCHYGNGNPCNNNEWAAAVQWINGDCTAATGLAQDGFVYINSWAKSYGYDNVDQGFC